MRCTGIHRSKASIYINLKKSQKVRTERSKIPEMTDKKISRKDSISIKTYRCRGKYYTKRRYEKTLQNLRLKAGAEVKGLPSRV